MKKIFKVEKNKPKTYSYIRSKGKYRGSYTIKGFNKYPFYWKRVVIRDLAEAKRVARARNTLLNRHMRIPKKLRGR